MNKAVTSEEMPGLAGEEEKRGRGGSYSHRVYKEGLDPSFVVWWMGVLP